MSILSDLFGALQGLLGQTSGDSTGGGQAGGGIPGALVSALSQPGALQGLLGELEQSGLGNVAQSWVGNGANLPISPEQLGSVLNSSAVQSLANSTGLQGGELLQQLSQHLPQIISALTPNGQVPAEGELGQIAGGLLSSFGQAKS